MPDKAYEEEVWQEARRILKLANANDEAIVREALSRPGVMKQLAEALKEPPCPAS